MPAPALCSPGGHPLVGPVLRLDPLVPDDAADLHAVLSHPLVWAAGYGGGERNRPTTPQAMADFLAAILARGAGHAAYTLRLSADGPLGAAGTVVGTSSLGDVDLGNGRAHLGWTAYGPHWWGTTVNPQAKLLLLGHAFEDCGLERVKLQTDLANARSQAAIERLGAVREGILRHHSVRGDGSWRDTVVYSVLYDEWPAVRDRLERRVAGAAVG